MTNFIFIVTQKKENTMARGFTEQEKETIQKNLLGACRKSWTQYGYKKTNVDDLCRQTGISKGAFYLFHESKEALFCQVLCAVQDEIYRGALEIMEKQPDKSGAARALKFVYGEYSQNCFLYDSDSADFTMLRNRLSEEQRRKLDASNQKNRQLFCCRPFLKLKVHPDLALSVIYSLLMNMKQKDILPYSHRDTFDFMVEHLIDHLYE